MNGSLLRDLLLEAGVEVLDRGHGVAKGNFNIRCPLCGAADRGHHMGIKLENGWWGCWRNAEHRGKSPVRLMTAALALPVYEVRRLLGIRDTPDPGTFGGLRERLVSTSQVIENSGARVDLGRSLRMPREFRTFDLGEGVAERRFVDYLHHRGYTGSALWGVIDRYGLRFAVSGDYRDRVIIPYYYKRALVTWTARSVHAGERLRYRDLEQDASVVHKSDLLFNYDGAAYGGRALVVLEGPFDVIKGDWSGSAHGVRCVGLGTNNISMAQVAQLAELSEVFDSVYIAMDTESVFDKMNSYIMARTLRGLVDVRPVPGIEVLGKDVGGASIRDVSDFFRGVAAWQDLTR